MELTTDRGVGEEGGGGELASARYGKETEEYGNVCGCVGVRSGRL